MTVPHEISQATAYQASLLAALGGDDPAVADATTPATIRALLEEAGPDVRVRPEPDEPEIVGYDQALWVDRLHQHDPDPEGVVALFEALRTANLAL